MKTRKLALNAVLAAMCAALGALALDLNSIKITFESFPILLGALLFGPLDGLAVGFVGTLLYQLLRYGVSATTLLWILPYALAGLVTGFYAKRRGFSLTIGQTVGIVVAAEVLVTALNTLVMYIDAKLYGYWFPGFISAMLLPRGAVCVVKAVVFGLVLPKLCARVRRALPGEGGKTPPRSGADARVDAPAGEPAGQPEIYPRRRDERQGLDEHDACLDPDGGGV